MIEHDAVDAIVQGWQLERPELDVSAKHITGRIVRLAALIEEAYDVSYTQVGISRSDFGILSPLASCRPPLRAEPDRDRQASDDHVRRAHPALDRLERLGLIERFANEDDRRSRSSASPTPA